MDFSSFPSVIISLFQTGNSGPPIKLRICSQIWLEAADLPTTQTHYGALAKQALAKGHMQGRWVQPSLNRMKQRPIQYQKGQH